MTAGGMMGSMKDRVQKVDESALQEIVRRIVEVAAPERIILFGSAARGEMGSNSDIDLLVIKSRALDRWELTYEIRRNLRDVDYAFDIIVATPEDIERYGNSIGLVYRPALREGRVIYDAA
jgi:predicted nucleotidyltransferase